MVRLVGIYTDHGLCWGSTSSNMTIVSVFSFASDRDDIALCIRQNRIEYATRHGFRYCEFNTTLKSAHRRTSPTVDRKFSRYLAVHDILSSLSEYAFYLDADAFFTDMEPRVDQDYVQPNSDYHMIFGAEGWWDDKSILNSGVFIARNTSWSRTFMTRVVGHHEGLVSDQATIKALKVEDPVDFDRHVVVVPWGTLQATHYRPPALWVLFGWDVSFTQATPLVGHWTTGTGISKYDSIKRYLGCDCSTCQDSILTYFPWNPCFTSLGKFLPWLFCVYT